MDRRREALLQDQDRGKLEKIGVIAARNIGRQARLAGLRAYRRRGDVANQTVQALNPLVSMIADAMVAAHFRGIRRVARNIQTDTGRRLRLGPYDSTLAAQQRLLGLTDSSLDDIRFAYTRTASDVLGGMSRRLDQRITDELADLARDQVTTKEGVRRLREVYAAAGIEPGNSYALENLFRTQIQTAYSAGRWQALREPAIDDILWGFEYVTVGDGRVRPTHQAMDGIRLPKDDPFWLRAFPPNGYSCRCAAIEIFEGDAEARIDRKRLPGVREIDGERVQTEPDAGFGFNPGRVVPGVRTS